MPQNICGNCFSAMKGNKCPHCGYTREQTYREHDILSVGTVLMNRYVVGKLLGRGGFGITYLAYDTKAERAVAVKEYYPDGTAVRTDDNVTVEPMTSLRYDDYSHGLERFFSEAGIIKQFNGVNDIPEVYDVFRENGTAEGKIKLSSRDRQILYCMKLESGIEYYSGTVFDDQYMNEITAPFDDGEYETLALE